MAALTRARLSREWGHAWLITGPTPGRMYTASRLRPRAGGPNHLSVHTLRGLRTRLEQIDTDERDPVLPRLRPALPRRDRTTRYFRVPPGTAHHPR
ncbi:hypothetical protein CLV63_12833 [Murinocardiopsis flavida]|uniref:Uncharacterized protein n=1 Tax=Murinocardiopsis flavida TaxID=645275 RepID=A0A2P8CVF6_9ACTN|nr:hypothetical protein [Murinocardiopsis flavida]PSK88945.1 hypothetical protein CLV63_12833 [Murinocardiopsis flavida]